MMANTPAAALVEAPSRKRITAAAIGALAIAALVLFAAVLPAEYGKDPLGTGKALGLLDLYEASAGTAPPLPPAATTTTRPRAYNVDSSELKLGPGQAFEYKYRLEKGASMVYAWKTTDRVKYEFHGEPDDHSLKVESYEKQEGDYASGGLTAGFAGIHGWYWENAGERELTITVHGAGFFTSAEELRPKWDPVKHKNRVEHIPHELSTSDGASGDRPRFHP
jgi:hypothetical protein